MRRNDIINELVARGFSAEAQESIKNGVVFEGIVIRNDDVIAPIIYTQRLIEDAEAQGKSLTDVVADVIRVYEENKHLDLDLETLMSREFVLENVYIGVQKQSEEALVKKSCEDLEGIEAYLYVRGGKNGDASYSVKLTAGYLAHALVTEKEAWEMAEKHTYSETEIQSIAQMLAEMSGIPFDASMEADVPMYVITNGCRTKGASAILDKEALKRFAEEKGTDKLIVLPSSVHEMLIIPYDITISMDEMNEMVKTVNDTNVAPEERLTDRAYIVTI